MKQLAKARPVDKVEQAVRAIQDYIIDGELEPGTFLPSESDMVKQIGVSKFSVREALRVTQSQGLIEISQGRRTRVAGISVKPAAGIMNLQMKRSKTLLLELTEARRSLEISIVELASLRRTDEQVDAMAKTIADMKTHKEDLDFCVNKDIEFHEIMVKATKNRVFEMIHETLVEMLKDSRKETLRISGAQKPIVEHQAILEAIREKAPEKAVQLMNTHLDTVESNMKDSIRESS